MPKLRDMMSHATICPMEIPARAGRMSGTYLWKPEHMATIHFLREITVKVQRLVDDRDCPEQVRKMAGEVLDLSALLATWPVPRSLKLDEDLKRQCLQLCRISGGALCGTQTCMADDGEGSSAACGIA